MASSSSSSSSSRKKSKNLGIMTSSSSRKKSKKHEGDGTMRPEEEVKEEEWVVITGGSWEYVPDTFMDYEYMGDNLQKHIFKVPVKNLTFEVLKNRVIALGVPVEEGKFGLSYIIHAKVAIPPRDHYWLDLTDQGFKYFTGRMDKIRKPVTLYHRTFIC